MLITINRFRTLGFVSLESNFIDILQPVVE